MAFHNMQGLSRQFFFRDKFRTFGHQFRHRTLQEIHALGQAPADIPVGKKTDHDIVVIHHRNSPQAFIRNNKQGFGHGSRSFYHRVFAAGMHNIPHSKEQFPPQASAGMEYGKLFRRKMMFSHEGHSQSIPEGQGRRGAGGRCQPQGAGFFFYSYV